MTRLDAARFYFGNLDTEVYSFPGYRTLDKFLAELEETKTMEAPEPWQAQMPSSTDWGSIPEGSRMEKRILEKKQRNLEEMVIKGKAQMEDLLEYGRLVRKELLDFTEIEKEQRMIHRS